MNKKQKKQPPRAQVTDLLLELGNTYLEHGEYDKAINKLTQLIQLDQNNCDAFVNLSKAYILKKQFDTETQSIFEQTLEYTPDDLLIYKVLSQMYLQEERLDDRALKIYFKVFQQDKQNSENLFQKLLSLSLSKDKFETTQKLMQQLETGSFRFQQALQLYLNELWKKNKFEDASLFLTGILKSEQDNYFLRLFILNQLKANKIADSNFKIAEKNLDILINFVKSENSIDILFDIYLFLAANRLLKKFPAKTNPKTAKQIEEFELFLSGNSFSNIWDRGLDKNISPVSDAGVDFNDLWEKLAIYLPDQNNFAQPEAEITQQENFRTVLDNANCMMLIKTKQENIQDVRKFLSESIQSKTNKTKSFIQGFSTKDGLLIFWENVETLIKVAFDLVNKQSPQNNGDIINSYQTEIVLHTISLTNNRDYTYLFDDLEMALAILQPEKQFISKKTKDDVPIDQSQIYITSAVHNLVENESTILFTPSDIIAEHPVSHDKFLVYNLCPENTLIKIKNGDIKNIGRYNLIKELFQNEIFVSYKALDTYLERPVIVKILRPEFRHANAGFVTDEVFLNNTKLLGKFNHPDVALIYDVGKEQDLCYFAREFIEGETLKVPKKLNKKIDWQKAVNLGTKIADILAEPHKKKIIHGRLKPNNIFILNKNTIKLTDFQINEVCLPVQHLENGSLNYLTYYAPEYIKENSIDLFSDIYSLGVILYEMLTGFNPFFFKERQKIIDFVLNKMPDSITKHNSKLPGELNNVVFKAIAKDPKKRFGSMQEFGGELKKIIEKT